MCDTMVSRTKDTGMFLFAKNSDRDPGEPQIIQYVEGREGLDEMSHPEHRDSYDKIQYRRLVEAAKGLTNPIRALISRPSWIWGAEMGVNERGLAIGNEAVFARSRVDKQGLLGMDILRLALHNASNAREGVDFISRLLQEFGQGGNGSYAGTLRYHNSFLLADAEDAWVFESAGKRWAARQVGSVASISNAYSIGKDYHLADEQTGKDSTDFAALHASRLHLWFTKGEFRRERSRSMLEGNPADWETMATILRHNEGKPGSVDHSMRSICMDATGFVKSRTASSMIVEYHDGVPLVWMTGAPLPAYSPFLPFTVDDSACETAPHADIRFAYRFARERLELIEHILIAPQKARERIAQVAIETELRCRSMILEAQKGMFAQTAVAALAEEQTFRNQVREVLVEFGAESKSLHEKPDSYYRCG